MYDFYFGSNEEISNNKEKYLLSVKAELKMENSELLNHRFDCWKVV